MFPSAKLKRKRNRKKANYKVIILGILRGKYPSKKKVLHVVISDYGIKHQLTQRSDNEGNFVAETERS